MRLRLIERSLPLLLALHASRLQLIESRLEQFGSPGIWLVAAVVAGSSSLRTFAGTSAAGSRGSCEGHQTSLEVAGAAAGTQEAFDWRE